MKRTLKNFATAIRFSIDGKTWSDKMTIVDFIKKHPKKLIAVEICEVMSRKEAMDLLLAKC